MTNNNFGPRMAQMFLKICYTIHENAADLPSENQELSEHIRQTAEILHRRSIHDGIDLGLAKELVD